MKRLLRNLFFILFVFILFSLNYAQIPNASFESWTDGEPNGWRTGNSPNFIPFTQTNDAHQGSYAIKGTVISLMGIGLPIGLVSGSDEVNGFPINFQPEALHGWYKFSGSTGDILLITVTLSKSGSGMSSGATEIISSNTNYQEFVVNTNWATSEIPDTAIIIFQIANDTTGFPNVGTYFIVDDLSWGTATDVENETLHPTGFELSQNYPNPFNPITNIQYSVGSLPGDKTSSQFVTLKVYDVLGDEVATLVNEEKEKGIYTVAFDASKLSSGIYSYRLAVMDPLKNSRPSFVETKKMVLIK